MKCYIVMMIIILGYRIFCLDIQSQVLNSPNSFTFYQNGSHKLHAILMDGKHTFDSSFNIIADQNKHNFDSWRPATKGELFLIYEYVKQSKNILIPLTRYWSGSYDGKFDTPFTWFLDFSNGIAYHNSSNGRSAEYMCFAVLETIVNTSVNHNQIEIGSYGDCGGIVFFVGEDYYLEVSALLGESDWYSADNIVSCYEGGGKDDWRLPTNNELLLIYKNLVQTKAAGIGRDRIWSSQIFNKNNHWFIDLSNGILYNKGNGESMSMRPFRAVRKNQTLYKE